MGSCISSLAYPNSLGTKDYVVVVVCRFNWKCDRVQSSSIEAILNMYPFFYNFGQFYSFLFTWLPFVFTSLACQVSLIFSMKKHILIILYFFSEIPGQVVIIVRKHASSSFFEGGNMLLVKLEIWLP